MDVLLQKYNDYIRLKNCRAEYLLSNGMIIDFTYKEENFIHLLGLHKLTDIQLIQLFNDKNNKKVKTKYIISRIKKNKFTDTMVKASVFYNDIADRYSVHRSLQAIQAFAFSISIFVKRISSSAPSFTRCPMRFISGYPHPPNPLFGPIMEPTGISWDRM